MVGPSIEKPSPHPPFAHAFGHWHGLVDVIVNLALARMPSVQAADILGEAPLP